MANKKLYVASPYGFSEAGKEFLYGKLMPMIGGCGYGVIDPWKLTPDDLLLPVLSLPPGIEKTERLRHINRLIGSNNEKGIIDSDGLFAVLDGQDVDSGVASEIGFASSLKKPVAGYRGDFRQCSENEGTTVNLQVEHFIYRNGGEIIRKLEDVPAMLLNVFGSPTV